MRRAVWPLALLVVATITMFLLGFPLRTYMDQRASLAQARQTVVQLASQNRGLRADAAQLQTPAEIERLARERYGLVRPGQEEYAILPAPPLPQPAARPATARSGSESGPGSGSGSGALSAAGGAGSHPAGSAPAPGPGLWSRFLHQLEFWS